MPDLVARIDAGAAARVGGSEAAIPALLLRLNRRAAVDPNQILDRFGKAVIGSPEMLRCARELVTHESARLVGTPGELR